MSEASDADRFEQELPLAPDDEDELPTLEPEAPDADALEQHLAVPGDEDEYDRP